MLEKLTDNEERLLHVFCDPIKLSELIFPENIDTLDSFQNFDPNSKFKPRQYQIPMYSFEYCLAEDPDLSKVENFKLKKRVSDAYNFSGRGCGKSLQLLIDMCLEAAYYLYERQTLVSSLDDDHVALLMNPFIKVLNTHPFFKMLNANIKLAAMEIETGVNRGHQFVGVGMALTGQSPGSHFEGKHAQKIIGDEMQYETDEVVKKRSQAGHPTTGACLRFSGITDFTRHSSMGKIVCDPAMKSQVINLPKSVAEDWNDFNFAEAVRDYDGTETHGFKTHIDAEIVEDTESAYDMEKVRECYQLAFEKKHLIKHFEITKDNFTRFKELLILSKPKGCERVFVAEDWGEKTAEIVIWFEMPKEPSLYKYEYNITLQGLSEPSEHFEIHKYLIEELKVNFVGLDATEQGGKQVIRELQKEYPDSAECFVPIGLNTSFVVDYKRNKKGEIIEDSEGKMIPVKEHARVWANHCMKKLWYQGRVISLYDPKLDKQFAAMREKRNGTNVSYFSALGKNKDHLHAACEVMVLLHHLKENNFQEEIEDSKNQGAEICTVLKL